MHPRILAPESMSGSVQADMSSDLLTEGCLEYSDLVLMSFGPHLGPVPLLASEVGSDAGGRGMLMQLFPAGVTAKKIRSSAPSGRPKTLLYIKPRAGNS